MNKNETLSNKEVASEVVFGSELENKTSEISREEFEERRADWLEAVQERIDSYRKLIPEKKVSGRGLASYNWEGYYFAEADMLIGIAEKLNELEIAQSIKTNLHELKTLLNEAADIVVEDYASRYGGRVSPYTAAGVYRAIGNEEKSAQYRKLGEEYHEKEEQDRLSRLREDVKNL